MRPATATRATPAHSPACLARSTTYPLKATTRPSADAWARTWADFNQDGVFSPGTGLGSNSVGRQHPGSLRVPERARPGATRLRLVSHLPAGQSSPFYGNGCPPPN